MGLILLAMAEYMVILYADYSLIYGYNQEKNKEKSIL